MVKKRNKSEMCNEIKKCKTRPASSDFTIVKFFNFLLNEMDTALIVVILYQLFN